MKSSNPHDKVNKIEATRMLMKERAKSKGRAIRKEIQADELGDSVGDSSPVNRSNQSINESTLDVSTSGFHNRMSSKEKEKAKDEQIFKMIKNASYESVLLTQKRHAAWDAFTENWAMGFKKNDDLIITKKKRRVKKSPKQKFVDISDGGELEYNDKMSRHIALKKYKEAFDKTAASYRIESH
jgi:hypothetical protein